jgi:hypothetical protein
MRARTGRRYGRGLGDHGTGRHRTRLRRMGYRGGTGSAGASVSAMRVTLAPMVLLRYPALLIVVVPGPRCSRSRPPRRRCPVGDAAYRDGLLERPHITRFMAGLTFGSTASAHQGPQLVPGWRDTISATCSEVTCNPLAPRRGGTGDPGRCRRGTTDMIGPALRRARRGAPRARGGTRGTVWVPELMAKTSACGPAVRSCCRTRRGRSRSRSTDGHLYLAPARRLLAPVGARRPGVDHDDVAPRHSRSSPIAPGSPARALGQRPPPRQAPVAPRLSFEDAQALTGT